MKDISRKIIDVYDDLEFAGLKKIASAGLPDEVKKMELATQEKLASKNDDDFGLICYNQYSTKVRRFPIFDKGNTWLSAQYFDKTASALTPVLRDKAAHRIKVACDRFDINSYPKSLDGEFEKQASQENVYALRKEYPINTKQEIKIAAGFFNKYASQFNDPKDRNVFASNVISRANEILVEIQDNHKESLTKYASNNYNKCINIHLDQRKKLLLNDEKQIKFLEKVAKCLKEESPQSVADTLYDFDKKAGISKYWDSKLLDPYKSVMEMEKKASYIFDVGDGDMSDKDLIKVLKGNKARSYLGAGVVKTAQQNPVAIFESLPETYKEIIYNIHKGLI